MRKGIVACLLAIVCMVGLMAGCRPVEEIQQATQSQTPQKIVINQQNERYRSITVEGKGEVVVIPDIAEITVYVRTQGEDAKTALAENNDIMAAVTLVLDEYAIPKEDRTTQNVRTSPIYDYSQEQEKITGYSAYCSLNILSRQVDRAGEMVSRLVEAGAQVGNVSFDVEDTTQAYHEALQLAMEDARKRADVLAEAGGLTVCGTWSVAEGSARNQVYYTMASNDMAVAEDSLSAVNLEPGEVRVSASVTVEYDAAQKAE